jgi:hypothetical protein
MVEYSARMGNNNAILNIFFAPYILAMIVIRFSFSTVSMTQDLKLLKMVWFDRPHFRYFYIPL